MADKKPVVDIDNSGKNDWEEAWPYRTILSFFIAEQRKRPHTWAGKVIKWFEGN